VSDPEPQEALTNVVTRIGFLVLLAGCITDALLARPAIAQYRFTDAQGTVRTEQYKAKIPAEYRDAAIWIGPTGTSSIQKAGDKPTDGSNPPSHLPRPGKQSGDRDSRPYYAWTASSLNNFKWTRGQVAYDSQEECEEDSATAQAKIARGGDALRKLGVVPPGGRWEPNVLDKAADSVSWCLRAGDTPSSQRAK